MPPGSVKAAAASVSTREEGTVAMFKYSQTVTLIAPPGLLLNSNNEQIYRTGQRTSCAALKSYIPF